MNRRECIRIHRQYVIADASMQVFALRVRAGCAERYKQRLQVLIGRMRACCIGRLLSVVEQGCDVVAA